MFKRSWFYRFVIAIVVFSTTVFLGQEAFAAPDAEGLQHGLLVSVQPVPSTVLDLIIVVQQSSAMDRRFNDPDGLRFEALEALLGYLAWYQVNVLDGNGQINVAVIYFGQTASVIQLNPGSDWLDLSLYSAFTLDSYLPGWEMQLSHMTCHNNPDCNARDQAASANLLDATRLALDLFAHKKPLPNGQRGLMFLSSGVPCLDGWNCDLKDTKEVSLDAMEEHLQLFKSWLDTALTTSPNGCLKDGRVYALLPSTNFPRDLQDEWDSAAALWGDGHLGWIQTPDQIRPTILNMLSPLLESIVPASDRHERLILSPNPRLNMMTSLNVPAFVSSLKITSGYDIGSGTNRLCILPPRASDMDCLKPDEFQSQHTEGNSAALGGPILETWTILNPEPNAVQPGSPQSGWRVRRDSLNTSGGLGDDSIHVAYWFTNISFEPPSGVVSLLPTYYKYQQVKVGVRLSPDYPFKQYGIDLNLLAQGVNTETARLDRDSITPAYTPQGDGHLVGIWYPLQATVTYTLTVSAFDRVSNQLRELQRVPPTLSVSSQPVRFKVICVPISQILLPSDKVDIRVQLWDSSGTVIVSGVFDLGFNVSFLATTTESPYTVDMNQPDPNLPAYTGTYRVETNTQGNHKLQVNVVVNPGGVNYPVPVSEFIFDPDGCTYDVHTSIHIDYLNSAVVNLSNRNIVVMIQDHDDASLLGRHFNTITLNWSLYSEKVHTRINGLGIFSDDRYKIVLPFDSFPAGVSGPYTLDFQLLISNSLFPPLASTAEKGPILVMVDTTPPPTSGP